jgi:hypothetical protein
MADSSASTRAPYAAAVELLLTYLKPFKDFLLAYLKKNLPDEIYVFVKQSFEEVLSALTLTQCCVLFVALCAVSWVAVKRIWRVARDCFPAGIMLVSSCFSLLTLIFFITSSIHTVLFVVDASNDELTPLFPWTSYQRMLFGSLPAIALTSLVGSMFWQSWSASVTRLSNVFAKNTNQPAVDRGAGDDVQGGGGGGAPSAGTRQVPGELLIRTVFVFLIAASRLHWRVFVDETPLFFLFVAAHYFLIRLAAAKHSPTPLPPCLLYLTAAHAFSPFFERFSRSRAFHGSCTSSSSPSVLNSSAVHHVPDAVHCVKDGIVVIIWHAASLWALYAAHKHLSGKKLPAEKLLSKKKLPCEGSCADDDAATAHPPLPAKKELAAALPHASAFLPRAAAALASLCFLPLLLHFFFPKGFLVLQRAFPHLFQTPLHAHAAALPWCLWTYFTAVHARQLHSDAFPLPLHTHLPSHLPHSKRQQSRITSRDVFLFLDHAISLSSGLLRRVRATLLWLLLCTLLFSWAFYSALDKLDIVDFKWAIDPATQQLLVNTTAAWPVPYAIFHKFPHPSVLPYQAGLPHASGNNTPIVCSIEVHK